MLFSSLLFWAFLTHFSLFFFFFFSVCDYSRRSNFLAFSHNPIMSVGNYTQHGHGGQTLLERSRTVASEGSYIFPRKKKFQLDGWRALYLFLDLLESLSYFISVVVFCMGQITTRPISGPFSLSLSLSSFILFQKVSSLCISFWVEKTWFYRRKRAGLSWF